MSSQHAAICRNINSAEKPPAGNVDNWKPYHTSSTAHPTFNKSNFDTTTSSSESAKQCVMQTPTRTPSSTNSQPDIQSGSAQTLSSSTNQKMIQIVDLAVTFEDTTRKSLDASRAAKIDKYTPLRDWYRSQGYQANSEALVYGSLGSILPSNYSVLTTNQHHSRNSSRPTPYEGAGSCGCLT